RQHVHQVTQRRRADYQYFFAHGADYNLRLRHSTTPMVIPLAHTTAIPSQVSGSGNCPHISQPRPAALIICKYTKGASIEAGALRYACICSKCPSAPQKPVEASTTHCKGLRDDSTGS